MGSWAQSLSQQLTMAAMEMAARKVLDFAVVSGGDAAPILEAAEHALDDVAFGVAAVVVGEWDASVAFGRDDGGGSSCSEPVAQGVGVIALCRRPVRRVARQGMATAISATLPGVTMNVQGLPRSSHTAWSLLWRPCWVRLISWAKAPLCAPGDAVRPDQGGIDEEPVGHVLLAWKRRSHIPRSA